MVASFACAGITTSGGFELDVFRARDEPFSSISRFRVAEDGERATKTSRKAYRSDHYDVVNGALSRIQRCLYEREARHRRMGQNSSTSLLLGFAFVARNGHKFLDSFRVVNFARVQVPVRIGRDLVHPVELASVATAMARLAHHIPANAVE